MLGKGDGGGVDDGPVMIGSVTTEELSVWLMTGPCTGAEGPFTEMDEPMPTGGCTVLGVDTTGVGESLEPMLVITGSVIKGLVSVGLTVGPCTGAEGPVIVMPEPLPPLVTTPLPPPVPPPKIPLMSPPRPSSPPPAPSRPPIEINPGIPMSIPVPPRPPCGGVELAPGVRSIFWCTPSSELKSTGG